MQDSYIRLDVDYCCTLHALKGCKGFLTYIIDTKASEVRLKDIYVLRNFLDVFPKDLLGLAMKREINFAIDLVPNVGPISLPPYQMDSTKLKELKT